MFQSWMFYTGSVCLVEVVAGLVVLSGLVQAQLVCWSVSGVCMLTSRDLQEERHCMVSVCYLKEFHQSRAFSALWKTQSTPAELSSTLLVGNEAALG